MAIKSARLNTRPLERSRRLFRASTWVATILGCVLAACLSQLEVTFVAVNPFWHPPASVMLHSPTAVQVSDSRAAKRACLGRSSRPSSAPKPSWLALARLLPERWDPVLCPISPLGSDLHFVNCLPRCLSLPSRLEYCAL